MPGTLPDGVVDFMMFIAQQATKSVSLGYYGLALTGTTLAAVLGLALLVLRTRRPPALTPYDRALRMLAYHARMAREATQRFEHAPFGSEKKELARWDVASRMTALDHALRAVDEALKG